MAIYDYGDTVEDKESDVISLVDNATELENQNDEEIITLEPSTTETIEEKPKKKKRPQSIQPKKPVTQKKKPIVDISTPIATDFSALGGPKVDQLNFKEVGKTNEYKKQQLDLQNKQKKQTELEQSKMEARYAKVALAKNNKDFLTQTKPSADYILEVDDEIKNKVTADGTDETYMVYGKNDFTAPEERTRKINSFPEEKKEVITELQKAGTLSKYNEKAILGLAAEKYKKKKLADYVNDKTVSFYTNTSEETKNLFEDYNKKNAKFLDLDLEKKTTVNGLIYDHLNKTANEIIPLEKKLKSYGTKPVFKTQKELDDYKEIYDEYNSLRGGANELLTAYSRNNNAIGSSKEKLQSAEKEYDLAKRNYGFLTGAGVRTFGAFADMGGSIIQLTNFFNPVTRILGGNDEISEYVALSTREGQEMRDAYLGQQEKITDLTTFGKASFNVISSQLPNWLLMYATGGASGAAEKAAALGAKEIAETALLEGAELTAKQIAEKTAADIGLGAFKTVAENNQYVKLMDLAVNRLSLSPELASIAVVSGGQKYSEQVASNALGETNFTPLQMLSSSVLYGYAEGLSEKVTLDILKGGGRTLEALVKQDDKFVSMLKDKTVSDWFGSSAKFVGKKVTDFANENVSEQFANLAQNSIDKFILGKNVNLLDNTGSVFKDTSLLSAWMISAPHVAGLAIKPFLGKDQTKEIKQNSSEIARIVDLLKNPDLSSDERNIFKNKIKELSAKSETTFKNTIKDIDGMPNNTFKTILTKSNELGTILQKAKTIYNSDSPNKVEAVKILEEQYKQKETELNSLVGRTKMISKLDENYSNEDKAKLFNLNNKEADLKNEINVLKNENNSDAILIEKNNQLKNVKEKITDIHANALVTKFTNRAVKAAESAQLDQNIFQFATSEEAEAKANELKQSMIDSDGERSEGLEINGTIIIDREQAAKMRAFNVAGHEILHKFLRKTLYKTIEIKDEDGNVIGSKLVGSNAVKGMAEAMQSYLNKIDTSILDNKDFKARIELYKDKPESVKAEEILTLFTDALALKQIELNESSLTKIGDYIRRVLQDLGFINIEFKDGKDVLNFLKDYNSALEKGKMGRALKKASSEGIKVGEGIKKYTDDYNGEAKASKTKVAEVQEKIDKLEDQYDNDEIEYEAYENKLNILEEELKKAKAMPEEEAKIKAKENVSEEEFNKLSENKNVYYHGTSANVTEDFIKNEVAKDFPEGASSFSVEMQGLGKHFTKSIENAKSFIDHRVRENGTGSIAAVNIKTNNPKIFKTYQDLLNNIKSTINNNNLSILERNKLYLKNLKNLGFDSILYKEGPSYNPSKTNLMSEVIIPFDTQKELIGFADYLPRNGGMVPKSAKKIIEKSKAEVKLKVELSQEDEVKEIIKNDKGSVASDKVQQLYDNKGVEAAYDIIKLFKPITNKIVDKRRDAPGFDSDMRQLLTDEIETGAGGILDLIKSYNAEKGVPLAAYINKQLPLRAIASSRRVLDKDFKKDVAEEKGLMAEETASEAKEKPKYKNALESKVFEPEVIKTMVGKILTNMRTLKSRIDEPISLNRTITPLIAEIRDAMGKQLDIDVKTAMGGKKDNEFRNWLLKNKRYMLENMTTTWLMAKDGQGGIPQAIQKQIDGKWVSYPDWVGQKIDRETTSTDQAGRTSGAELVRRLPNVFNNVSDADYLGQFIGPDGNPIRGRKESGAKAVAEEMSFDIINNDFESNGPILDAFSTNQERQGVEIANNIIVQFVAQSERGNIKRSKTYNNFNDQQKELFNQNINKLSAQLNPFLNNINRDLSINRIFRNIFSPLLIDNKKAFTENDIDNLIKDFTPWLRQMRDIDKSVGLYLEDENFDFNKFIENIALANDEIPLDVLNILDIERGLYSANNVNSARDTTKNMFRHWYDTLGAEEAVKMMVYLNGTYKYNTRIGKTIGLDVNESGIVFETGEKVPKNKSSKQIAKNASDYWDNFVYASLPGGASKANIDLLERIKKETEKDRKTDSGSISYKDKDYIKRKKQAEYYRNITEKMFEFYFNKENKISNSDKAIMISQMNGSTESANRKSAILTYEYLAPEGTNVGALRYEHMIPANKVLAALVRAYAKTQDGKVSREVLDSIWKNYEAALVPVTMDNIFKKINLESDMVPGWNEDLPSYYRYYNYATFGKENLLPIINVFTGEIIGEEFVNASNAMREGIVNNTKIDAITKSSDSKYSKTPKGISVFDFDDTVGLTKSNVLYTMPDGSTGKLNGAEFAKEGSSLLEAGAEFDFSEFSKVVEGKPGPMVDKMKKMIGKFGPENFFILTARPANSAIPIHQFLSSIGIDIPLENITGLGNSTAQAKADWITGKAAEGYNDFYFTDDHLPNVNAVKNALDVLDVKSKIQQAKAKFSKSISPTFNTIIEQNKDVESYKVFSDIVARRRGAKINRFDFYVPPSAADFELLLYKFMGKGVQGEKHKKFFADALLIPYINGNTLMDAARQSIKKEYKKLLNAFPDVSKKLESLTPDKDFTYDQAVRVAMWNDGEKEIPGISERDKKKLVDLVNNDPELNAFKNGLVVMGRQGIGWVEPVQYWEASTIISDLHNITEGEGRKKFLGEFIDNAEQMFGTWDGGKLVGPNINKVEAIYGTNVREAIEDILYRMTNGKNRGFGKDKETTAWSNWVNGSTGTIMFLNTRSAALQLIGAVNFLNFRDNNPFAAAKAFANQPQYWKDFSYIWNSDKIKERRGGLKEDVAAAEIANAAANSKNKVNAVMSYLLKIGYTPTQLADSFAIASGGAPYYRNRVNSYLKEGLSEQEAEKLAWQDFSKVADETQQSGDPRDISKQQASPAGRLLLTFQNTAMQQSRIVKKAILDLKNRRGDDKTNVSKIVYYLAIQNIMFSVLQQGLFAVAFTGDDGGDDEDKNKVKETKTKTQKLIGLADDVLDTILRGTGFLGGATATLKNMIVKYKEEADKKAQADYAKVVLEGANISPPIGSKLKKVYSALNQTKYDKDLIAKRGWGVMQDGRVHLGPMYSVTGKLAEAGANIPLDRLVNKIENVSQAMNSQNKAWQRVMIGLGWSPYSVGIKSIEGDTKIKEEAKTERKEEGKIKSKEKRQATSDSIANLPEDEYKKYILKRKAEREARKDSINNLPPAEKQKYLEDKEKAAALKKRQKEILKEAKADSIADLSPAEKANYNKKVAKEKALKKKESHEKYIAKKQALKDSLSGLSPREQAAYKAKKKAERHQYYLEHKGPSTRKRKVKKAKKTASIEIL